MFRQPHGMSRSVSTMSLVCQSISAGCYDMQTSMHRMNSSITSSHPTLRYFRKDLVRGKLTRRDIIDIRDEHGLPYRNRTFRRFDEGDFPPPLTSVFDKDEADLVLATEPDTTGPSGIWLGPEVTCSD